MFKSAVTSRASRRRWCLWCELLSIRLSNGVAVLDDNQIIQRLLTHRHQQFINVTSNKFKRNKHLNKKEAQLSQRPMWRCVVENTAKSFQVTKFIRNDTVNNNNTNTNENVYCAVIMAESSESSPKSFDECRTAPSGRRPSDQAERLGLSPPVGCQSLHPPSPFIIITQPESWYSFYRPMEGRRLSWPSWLVTYRRRLSLISVLTGSDVVQLRWSRPMRYY